MDDSALLRFPGNLDPRAQEFFPTNVFGPIFPPPPHPQEVYFPYPPFIRSPPYCDGGAGYTHPLPPPLAPPPLESPYLPPPSSAPTRAIIVSMVSPDVSESLVRRELEVFGDVRAVQMERVREGIVTVYFYDLRHAQTALAEIQEQHMQHQHRLRLHYESVSVSVFATQQNFLPPPLPPLPPPARGLIAGRAVWAQFTIPATYGIAEGNNQGTLVIFNLDPNVSPSHLKDIFETFGTVKEMRGTPMKRHQRFVEFYDVRDAAKAMLEMNNKEINCKKILIQYSRPGGYGAKFPKYPHNNPTPNPKFHHHNTSPRHTQPPPSPPPRSGRFNNSSVLPWSSKKQTHSRGVRNGGSSIEDSMGALCINRNSGNHGFKKGSSKGIIDHSSSSSSSSSSKQYGNNYRRAWKGVKSSSNNSNVMKRPVKEHDPRFLINEDAIADTDCRDSRTTVMIKNIPNKYSQKLLLNMLDNHCIHCNEQIAAAYGGDDHPDHPKSSYDFVYLPIDFINKCNVGYGFVNMTSPQATWRLYKAFHQQTWEVFNSRKICEVTYARLQGLEALKEHFKNSKFPCEAEEYMPVVFSPPRDGKILTDPVPIVGRSEEAALDEQESDVDTGEDNGYTSGSMNDDCTGGGDHGGPGGNDDKWLEQEDI